MVARAPSSQDVQRSSRGLRDPQDIVANARRMVGTYAYSGYCQAFVQRAYRSGRSGSDAAGSYEYAKSRGNAGSGPPPVGAVVYFAGGRSGHGHAAIVSGYTPGGVPMVITTTGSAARPGAVVEVPITNGWVGGAPSLRYLGWTVTPGPGAALNVSRASAPANARTDWHGDGTVGAATDGDGKVQAKGMAAKVADRLREKGFSESGIAAILGNLQQESSMNPAAVNGTSGAYGLAQWLGERRTGLQRYARTHGMTEGDWRAQVDFIVYELKSDGRYRKLRDALVDGGDPGQLALSFSREFERAGAHESMDNARMANARKFFGGSSPAPSSGGGSGVSSGGGSGVSSVDVAGDASPADIRAELAANFGLTNALISLDKTGELRRVVDRIANEGITNAARVASLLQKTKWFKNHGAQTTKRLSEEKTAPGVFRQQVGGRLAAIRAKAREAGYSLSDSQLRSIARDAYIYDLNDDEVVQHIWANKPKFTGGGTIQQSVDFVLGKAAANGLYLTKQQKDSIRQAMANPNSGKDATYWVGHFTDIAAKRNPQFANRLRAGETLEQIAGREAAAESQVRDLKEISYANGHKPSAAELAKWKASLSSPFGLTSSVDIATQIRENAAKTYVPWADELRAGKDLAEVVSPYLDAATNLLERPVDLTDEIFRNGKGLMRADEKTGKLMARPLYELEQLVFKDPRWEFTQNAHQRMTQAGAEMMKRFGLVG